MVSEIGHVGMLLIKTVLSLLLAGAFSHTVADGVELPNGELDRACSAATGCVQRLLASASVQPVLASAGYITATDKSVDICFRSRVAWWLPRPQV